MPRNHFDEPVAVDYDRSAAEHEAHLGLGAAYAAVSVLDSAGDRLSV